MIRSKRPCGRPDVGLLYLKVKVLSLADEARTIRRLEGLSKVRRDPLATTGLADHRRGPVRSEARQALLAYGFLRGRSYKTLESKCHQGHEPDWARVQTLIQKYGVVYSPDESQRDRKKRLDDLLDDFLIWKKQP